MRWSDGVGGLLIMMAAMVAVVVLVLPAFASDRVFLIGAVVVPLGAFGGLSILYGRGRHI